MPNVNTWGFQTCGAIISQSSNFPALLSSAESQTEDLACNRAIKIFYLEHAQNAPKSA